MIDHKWLQNRIETANKLNGFIDEKITNPLLELYISTGDKSAKQIVDDVISIHESKLLSNELHEKLASEELTNGIVEIGRTFQGSLIGHPIRLKENYLLRHVGIYAQTGHGKSSLLYNIMHEFLSNKIPFLFIDRKKDGRALLRLSKDVIVIPWQNLKWNPLKNPPKITAKIHWQLLTEICAHSWGVYHAGSNYLLEWLSEFEEPLKKSGHYPTFVQLKEMMASKTEYSKKKDEYYQVMWNRVRSLVDVLGNVIGTGEGIQIEDLLDKHVVLELNQLRGDEQNWLIAVLLTYIYAYRMSESQRGETLRHVTIIDEAHYVFDAGIQWRQTSVEMGQPTINLFHTQFRDFGESLIITSQVPSQILHSVHANTLVKIVGNLGDAEDIKFISNSMGLTEEQQENIHRLKRGQWYCRINDDYTEVFLIKTDDHPASKIKNVSDDEVEFRLKEKLPKLFAVPQAQPVIDDSLSEDAMNLLMSVGKNPRRIFRNHMKAMCISGRRIERAKEELLQRELVKEANVKIGNYRPVLYLIPTEKSIELLKNVADITTLKRIGHAGMGHAIYEDIVAEAYALSGYAVFTEHSVGNRRYDVYAVANEKTIGIEIELTTENLKEKMQNSDVNELVFVFKDKQTLERMRATVSPNESSLLQNVRFRLIDEYMRIVRNKIDAEQRGINSNGKSQTESDDLRNKDRNKGEG